MKVTKEARSLMYGWLQDRYGMLEALIAIDKAVTELGRFNYAVVPIGDESVNVRPSHKKLSEGTPGIVGHGVRIWVNE